MTFTTADPWSGLFYLSIGVVVIGVLTTIGILSARRHGRTTLTLDVTDRLALVWIGLCAVGVVFAALRAFSSAVVLEGPVAGWVTGNEDAVTDSCEFAGSEPGPALECGGAVAGAPFGPRMLIFLGSVLVLLASAAIAWAIHVAARRAAAGISFDRVVARTFSISAVVMLVGTVIGGPLQQIGITLAARSLEWSADAQPPFYFEIPLWPFAVALGMFALAAIFRHGARLQQETEGLV